MILTSLEILFIFVTFIVSILLVAGAVYFFAEDESFFCFLCLMLSFCSFILFISSVLEINDSKREQEMIETFSEIETILENDSVEEYDVNVKYDNGTYTITIKE